MYVFVDMCVCLCESVYSNRRESLAYVLSMLSEETKTIFYLF